MPGSEHTLSHSSTERQRSHPDSLTSSSVITVRRGSGQSGPALNGEVQISSQSPADSALIVARTLKASASAHGGHLSSYTHDHLEAQSAAYDVVGNLETWSRSANSSRPQGGNLRNSRTGHGAAFGHFSDHTPRLRKSSGTSSPSTSPRKARPLKSDCRASSSDGAKGDFASTTADVAAAMRLPMSTLSPLDVNTLSDPHCLTPSSIGLLTPASYPYKNDYFGRAKAHDGASNGEGPDASPVSAHSRYSGRRPDLTPYAKARSAAPADLRTPEADDLAEKRSRTRERREKDKKATLAKALERANTAVLLDNAQNYEAALEAYADACKFLQRVMDRTSGQDDKRKLDAIRDTYTARIDELTILQASQTSHASQVAEGEKQLPPRPMSDGSGDLNPSLSRSGPASPYQSSPIVGGSSIAGIVEGPTPSRSLRDSFLTNAIREVEGSSPSGGFLGPLWERSRSPISRSVISEDAVQARRGLDQSYLPRPLSPRRASPFLAELPAELPAGLPSRDVQERGLLYGLGRHAESMDNQAVDTVSWLDTLEDSGPSRSSSVHSVTPGRGLRRRDIRAADDESHSEFDAAFDAAVEAAYEEGYEPDQESRDLNLGSFSSTQDSVPEPHGSESLYFQRKCRSVHETDQIYDEDAEEERILDDLAKDFMGDGFDFNLHSKSALPRESDSSGFSHGTRQSSSLSDRTTAGTSLSTLPELGFVPPSAIPEMQRTASSSSSTVRSAEALSDEISALPGMPETLSTNPPNQASGQILFRRSRRFSGPNVRSLKIETSVRPPSRQRHVPLEPATYDVEGPQSAHWYQRGSHGDGQGDRVRPGSRTSGLRRHNTIASPGHTRSNPASAVTDSAGLATSTSAGPQSSADMNGALPHERHRFLRKNKSSHSLRGPSTRPFSQETEAPLTTPLSATFMRSSTGRHESGHTFRNYAVSPGTNGVSHSGGLHLFDTTLSAATTMSPTLHPASPDSTQPPALEPCPDSSLLRPFWLLRSIASTTMHPRGGFITKRLFMPHEAWLNRSVKLKNVDDKIANCDTLSAALARLDRVDSLDADAVLEAVQGFEEVMERAQATLSKKLGGEVGVQSAGSSFKDAASAADAFALPGVEGSTARDAVATRSSSGKSYLAGWRKLRSKSAGVTVVSGSVSFSRGIGDRDSTTMASVPMTSFAGLDKRTSARRDLRDVVFEGPLKEYMASIARLSEAVHALDHIARQVEDPGLRLSSPTHVGLELSIRHASEFFAFYICRFLLADVGTLIDKYVKRSTEWVLAEGLEYGRGKPG